MGWMRTTFLGDIGNRLDIGDNENKSRAMRRTIGRNHADKRTTDRSQDQAIAALQAEVDDLKIAFGDIGNVLVTEDVFRAEEWQRMVEAMDAENEL